VDKAGEKTGTTDELSTAKSRNGKLFILAPASDSPPHTGLWQRQVTVGKGKQALVNTMQASLLLLLLI
jgi:hypothetical protein